MLEQGIDGRRRLFDWDNFGSELLERLGDGLTARLSDFELFICVSFGEIGQDRLDASSLDVQEKNFDC